MARHNDEGLRGENRAESYARALGYTILQRNYRYKRGEIDLIMQKDNILVFVEVKTRKNNHYGNPEDFVDEKKINLIHDTATEYMLQHQWNGPVRFDIIAVTDKEITLFSDAF